MSVELLASIVWATLVIVVVSAWSVWDWRGKKQRQKDFPPVTYKNDEGWWFWDETMVGTYGPYRSEREARQGLALYLAVTLTQRVVGRGWSHSCPELPKLQNQWPPDKYTPVVLTTHGGARTMVVFFDKTGAPRGHRVVGG